MSRLHGLGIQLCKRSARSGTGGRWSADRWGSQMGGGVLVLNPLPMAKPKNPSQRAPVEETYFTLDPEHTDPVRLKREREKARQLRKSQWWLNLVNRGICHHCGGKFEAAQLTMDHLVPLARGGTSAQGNIVPSCKVCNSAKGLETPVDSLFRQLEQERKPSSRDDDEENE